MCVCLTFLKPLSFQIERREDMMIQAPQSQSCLSLGPVPASQESSTPVSPRWSFIYKVSERLRKSENHIEVEKSKNNPGGICYKKYPLPWTPMALARWYQPCVKEPDQLMPLLSPREELGEEIQLGSSWANRRLFHMRHYSWDNIAITYNTSSPQP